MVGGGEQKPVLMASVFSYQDATCFFFQLPFYLFPDNVFDEKGMLVCLTLYLCF